MKQRLLARSALFVPGDRLKALQKAATLPADVVIIGEYTPPYFPSVMRLPQICELLALQIWKMQLVPRRRFLPGKTLSTS
jgi:hypothetical protein